MPEIHARRNSASASHRWMHCPPSSALNEKMQELFGEESSPFAAEGTKAHSVAELKLRHEKGELNDFNFKTQLAALGPIDTEMDRATNDYVDVVMEKFYEAQNHTKDAMLLVEQRLDFSTWAPGGFGTGDAVIISDMALEVCDLKYGKGVPVDAVENPQARLYGLGAYFMFEGFYGFKQVVNTIIQPRLNSVTSETLTVDELLAWGDSIRPLAEQSERGQGEFAAGEWCRFCRARAICRTRALESMKVFEPGFTPPVVIPDEMIPGILQVADVAEQWLKDVRSYALSRAMCGDTIKGYKLVHGRKPGRKWRDEEAVVDQLRRAGYESEQILTTPELKSVAAIEKVLGKQAFSALVEQFTLQPEGALSLVPESDKREAVLTVEQSLAALM